MVQDTMDDHEMVSEYFLYLISCRYLETKFIKIGKSKSLESRIKNIQTGCPHRIEKVYVIQSEFDEEISGIEQYIHYRFSSSCLHGEWYVASKDFIGEFVEEMERINSGNFSFDEIDEIGDEIHFDSLEILLHPHDYRFTEVTKEKGKYKNRDSFSFNEFRKRLEEYF